MFRVSVLVLALLVSAATAGLQAQAHPCDVPQAPDQTIASGAPHRVEFCSLQTDQVEAAVAYVDGVAFDLLPVQALSQPNVGGYVLYITPTPFMQVGRGTHTLQVAAYNRDALTDALQLGARSAPFPFGAVDPTPLPTAPVVKRVLR